MPQKQEDKEYKLLWDDIEEGRQQQWVPIYAPDKQTAFNRAEKYFWDVYGHRAGEVIVSTGLMSPTGQHLGSVQIPTSPIALIATGRADEALKLARQGKLGFMGITGR